MADSPFPVIRSRRFAPDKGPMPDCGQVLVFVVVALVVAMALAGVVIDIGFA